VDHADLKPVMNRVHRKIDYLSAKHHRQLKTQLQAQQSENARSLQLRGKQSPSRKEDSSAATFCLNDSEMKRLAMSELTKIPVKVLENRLHGLGDRITRHLSPEPMSNRMQGGKTPTQPDSPFKHVSEQKCVLVSPAISHITQSPKRAIVIARTESKTFNNNLAGGCTAVCAAAAMAIIFAFRIKNYFLPACTQRFQAAKAIQHAYLIHFYRNFYGSRKRRAAFFVLVRHLRRFSRRWRMLKRMRSICFIRKFLVSIKLRAKFTSAVQKKFELVRLG
jgi:hypothetical protein